MPCYLVRLIDDQEAVGLFSAEDMDTLFDLIDEVTDPALCECAEISDGGMIWPSGGARSIPIPLGDNDEDREDPPNVPTDVGPVTLTEGWLLAFYDKNLEFVAFADLQKDEA